MFHYSHPKKAKRGLGTLLSIWLVIVVAFGSWGIFRLTDWPLFAYEVFLAISSAITVYFASKYSLLSWRAGIPGFYLTYLVILPNLTNSISHNTWGIDEWQLLQGYAVATFGLGAFAFAVSGFSKIFRPSMRAWKTRTFKVVETNTAQHALYAVGALSTIFSILYGYSSPAFFVEGASINPFAGILSVTSFFLTVSHTAVWAQYITTGSRVKLRFGLLTLGTMILAGIFSNSKAEILYPFVYIAILQYSFLGRIPIKYILSIPLVYFLFAFPLISAFRGYQLAAALNLDRSDIVRAFAEYLLSGNWTELIGSSASGSNLDRGLLLYLSKIVSVTGDQIAYLGGATFRSAAEIFVPRFILPDKIAMNLGNVIAQRYEVIAPTDLITNVSPTLMGEFYMNFGLVGVIIGMLLIGGAAVVVDLKLMGNRVNWLMPVLIIAIGWQESFVGQTILPFIKNFAVLTVFLYVLSLMLRRQQSAEFRRSASRTAISPAGSHVN